MSPIWPFGDDSESSATGDDVPVDSTSRETSGDEQATSSGGTSGTDADAPAGSEPAPGNRDSATDDGSGTAREEKPPLDEHARSVEARIERAKTAPDTLDVAGLIDQLGAREEDRRREAGAVLSELAVESPGTLGRHIDGFADLVNDPRDDVRRAALAAVRDGANADPEPFRGLIDPIRRTFGRQSEDEAKVAGEALSSLLEPDDEALDAIVSNGIERLRERGEDERGDNVRILSALATEFPEQTVDELGSLLVDDDPSAVRYGVRILALVARTEPAATADLTPRTVELLESDDDMTRRFATELLNAVAAESPDSFAEHADAFATVLGADGAGTRRDAVGVLVEIARTNPDAVRPSVDALENRLADEDPIVRRDACYVLGVLRAEGAREAVETLLADAGPELSAIAERAIDRIDGETGDPPLPDIPPKNAFQVLSTDGESGGLSPTEREEIRQRRLDDRESGE